MKKLLILALASAFVSAANADVVVSSWGATSSGPRSANWTNAPSEESGVLKVDADAGDIAVLTPSGTAPAPQVKTVVTVVAQFDTINDVNELAGPGEGAKTAFTVANVSGTPRYRYWNGSGWAALDDKVTAVTNSAITIKIELDNSTPNKTEAAFKVGDTQIGELVTISSGTETTLSALAFAGTGTLTSVDATVTPAYATTATKRYASVSAALDDSVAVNAMTLHKYNGAFGEMPTPANNKVYYVKNASGTTADLGVFPASGEEGTAASPYTIGNLAELKAFQQYVAAGFTTQGKTFTQTADIELTEAWPGIGLQNGKDKVNDSEFTNKAFQGIYDGDNYTISNFQMVDGLDYCGFFNSTYNATIKNLKIQYAGSLFAENTTASTLESGATFVGVAKKSTLQNLTSLQKDANTAVSCSKGFGGIVGYTTSGTTVDSCTNNVNMTSLAGNKCGGIAMITQNGNAVTIRNCQNNGTQTTSSSNSEYGAIVGYVGLNTTIANCETTVGRFLKHQGNTVTLQGVNKGDARVLAYHGAATPGLNFATVDGNVATFVADGALAAGNTYKGNTYKVMATGATATYAFTAPGSIAFDKALVPNFEPTISAATGLELTSSDSGTVTTYTAAVQMLAVTVAPPTGVAVAKFEYSTDGGTTWTEVSATPYSVPYGATVKLTYAADGEYVLSGGTTETFENAVTAATTLTPSAVTAAPAVAKIGSTYYTTLAAAIGDAANNDTVTLLDNVTLAEALNLELGNKAVTLDLGAKTLTGRTNLKSGSLTIKNGTVAGGSQQALNVYGSADSTAQNYSVLTIASGVTVTADVYGVCMFGATAQSNGYGAVVNIAGTVTTTGTGNEGAVFVSGNLGQNVTGDAHNVINVTGTITSATDAAIAMNGLATVNVKDGATVTGNTAIAVKRGTLNIQGGTVHATGEKNYPGTPNYNGTEMTGAAISVSDTYSKYGAMGANVTGGTITSDNADAIYKKDGDYKNDAPIAVSGGTFSSSVPVEFCAAGFIPAQSGSTYGVEAGWKITWVVDGEKTVVTVKNGEKLTKPADPTKSGYEFKGWTPAVVETPVADATYTATWEQTAVPVVSTAETTLVAVPADCKAAELIDLSNRAEGDVLKAYNATTERYYTWVLAEDGSDLVWEVGKVFVTSADESTAESNKESAYTYQLKAGQAVWLTRKNPNATIKLAVAADGPVKVDVGIGYNLVAPPPAAEAYDATSLKVAEEGSFDEGDQIVVPTTTAPLSYTRKGGVWKVLSGEEQKPTGLPAGWGAVADPAWTEASKIEIPSGHGFWFNSKKAKKLEF